MGEAITKKTTFFEIPVTCLFVLVYFLFCRPQSENLGWRLFAIEFIIDSAKQDPQLVLRSVSPSALYTHRST